MALLANDEVDPRLQVGAPPVAQPVPVPPAPSRPLVAEPAEPAPVEADAGAPAAFEPVTEPVVDPVVDPVPAAPAVEPVRAAAGSMDAPLSHEPVQASAPSSESASANTVSPTSPPERPPAHLASSKAGSSSSKAESPERGFGGLAVTRPLGPSLHTLVAKQARNGASGAQSTTPAGLPKRVPGAQRPDAALNGARGWEPGAAPDSAPRSTPEDVYSFLSSFQSGVQRGLEETHSEPTGGTDQQMQDDR